MAMRLAASAAALGLLRGYAAIFFLDSPWAGAAFLGCTFWSPDAACAGLLAGVAAIALAGGLGYANWSSGLHIYNSILVGLALGYFYRLDGHTAGVVCVASALTVFLSAAIGDALWRLERLPALSLPFALAATIAALAGKSYGALTPVFHPYAPFSLLGWPPGDAFLRALGTIFFMPHPLPGLWVFAVLLCASRYMALLAIAGYAAGHFFQEALLGDVYSDIVRLNEFNFILTAIALGGFFTLPSWPSFALAVLSSALVALVSKALQNVMPLLGLSILPGAFLLVTSTMLAALRSRHTPRAPVVLAVPALPEVSLERARLAKARAVSDEPLLSPPFWGEWSVYQGFFGQHTHQPPWQYALDFVVLRDGRSFRGEGRALEDYYGYGLPVVAPAYGRVAALRADCPDNPPGAVDVRDNWGNYLSIDCGHHIHAVLAHLQADSLTVAVGDRVVPGQRLALCGNSGRSPQPHLHLHVQRGPYPGGATLPFKLGWMLVSAQKPALSSPSPPGRGVGVRANGVCKNQRCMELQAHLPEGKRFYLAGAPKTGETLAAATPDPTLAAALHLPVGRILRYRFRTGSQARTLRSLSVTLSLHGQFRLESVSGANAAFVATDQLLAFYDRRGPDDVFFDAWLLHFGLTPLAGDHIEWRDAPSVALLPLAARWKILYHGLQPFLSGLDSRYVRVRDDAGAGWIQSGEHLPAWPLARTTPWKTRAVIDPERGCLSLRLESAGRVWEADLQALEWRRDVGIPGSEL